jgi:hypothetical protein
MADAETDKLTRELAESRRRLSLNAAALAERANIARRLRQSVKRKPALWLGAAAVIGLLIAVRRPRARPIEIRTKAALETKQAGKAALAFGAVKIAFDIFRPAITAWARRQVSRNAR